jgi:hypothetical protein
MSCTCSSNVLLTDWLPAAAQLLGTSAIQALCSPAGAVEYDEQFVSATCNMLPHVAGM